MKQSVRDAFVDFTAALEGVVPWMYLDVKGLVTVAIGNLIDPVAAALSLPFVRKGTTTRATKGEILDEWTYVKNHPTAAKQGHRVLQTETKLRLTPDGVETVVFNRLELNDKILNARFPAFESWPADAQLATHSMAWACGPNFNFPRLAAMLNALDFADASRECKMATEGNPGIVPRNAANRTLYLNAARVIAEGGTGDELLWGSSESTREPSVITPDQLEKPGGIIHPPLPPWPRSGDND